MRDIQAILRLTHEQGLSVREVSERLKISKTTVSTYLLRAREAGLSCWPLPPGHDDATLERLLFGRAGRRPQDLSEPDFALIARELKRKGVTLTLLWQEYRAAHPDGYGYTWFCEHFAAFERRTSATFRNRHAAGAVMQTDYAGQTVPVIDPATGVIYPAQIFVAVLGASNLTFAFASSSQKLPDWIEGQVRALAFFGGVTRAIVCDNLKAGVVKALWFEPTLNATFAARALRHHHPADPQPQAARQGQGRRRGADCRALDSGAAEEPILLLDRRAQRGDRRTARGAEQPADAPCRPKPPRTVRGDRAAALKPLPAAPFEYAEWKSAKVHPDYHVEVEKTFYSVPHRLIGRTVEVRLTHRVVEIFHDHQRVASHVRRSQRSGHVTVNEHMPKAHQRYANTTPASLISRAARIGPNAAILVERMMRDRAASGTGISLGHGHPVAGAALWAGASRCRLRAGAADQRDRLLLRHRHPQSRPRPGQLRRTGKADIPDANIRGSTYYQ
ncbi:IS21 family transposase [Mesorhizobium sp.]|uniref:IS21 family transposase n=1 Tax=Mesorhizobium sp. TaxID=1871066 RepID=UPI0025BCF85E|nr:IS21 family transposase [Mesorhizobium sp.]